jgi:TetR/AcrR family transcriptional regulator
LVKFMPTKPTSAGRTREKRDPLATRQALMRAGSELFSERGFDGVALEDLAARAGFNKALVSYHFGGKRGLYVAILDSAFAAMAERLTAIEAGAPSARAALHGYVRAFEQMTRERPGFPTLFLREVLCTGIEPSLVPHLLEIIGVSRRLAERGAREGLFRRVDPLLMHFGLIGSLVFFFATEPARRKAAAAGDVPFAMPSADSFVRYLEELTLRGLAPDAHPSPSRRKGARA